MSKDDQDFCPISGDQHRYFIFKTIEVFEIYTPPLDIYSAIMGNKELALKNDPEVEKWFSTQLYAKKEYAVLGCNCGSVIRKEVKS